MNFNQCLIGAAVLSALSLAQAQTSIIPQIADGGGWQTTIVLTNTTASAASASLTFYEDTSAGATQNWNLTFLEVSSTQSLSVPAAGTLFLHTPGAAAVTSQGWAQLQSVAGVTAYAIFTQRVTGLPDQDGTAPAAASTSGVLVPFDNTSGFVTSVAIANPSSASESISVGMQPSVGTSSQQSPITLPAQGQMAFALPQQFSPTSGQRGLLEFYSASGSLSVLALRFNPTGAFTAAPVYQEAGPPIIVSGGSGAGSGTLPAFNQISIQIPNSPLGIETFTILGPPANGNYNFGELVGAFSNTSGVVTYHTSWSSVAAVGQTLTFNGLEGNSLSYMGVNGSLADITSGSVTVTLTPQAVATSGTVTGTLNLVSALATVSGAFTGTYTAQSAQ